ncbi:hypothetical protein [Enterocloster bolteae]|uniref:hypothetical protein n=1 Tax=Enterocloster bolteae TaxID=208479 RepID=UPI0028DBAA27|nr:hypothetical protein [Enterocloster bolteae]
MQGLMIYESPVIRLGFSTVMKREFDVDIDYTDREAVLLAVQALESYNSVEEFFVFTGWDKDNPECCSEEYLVENRICRWLDGKFVYFSRLKWKTSR